MVSKNKQKYEGKPGPGGKGRKHPCFNRSNKADHS